MKRLFFPLVLSVMIIACNDKNQKPTTKNETVTHQAELGCLNDKPKKSLNLDSVPADGCPVQ
jgi:ABC-type Fe3+-citrate transport system substrate-binding protein